MEKRSYRRPARSEKHNAGCMWALISLFDFRHGPPTPKLLSDRKNESSIQGNGYSKVNLDMLSSYEGKYEDANNVKETIAERADYRTASVKALMEEEMFQQHSEKKILSDEAQYVVCNLGQGTHSKNSPQQRSKRSKVISNDINQAGPASLDDQQSDNITLTEGSSLDFDLAAFLIEFYTDNKPCQEIHVDCDSRIDLCLVMKAIIQKMNDHPDEFDCQLDQKEFILYEALADIFEAIAKQKFVDEKHLVDKAICSKEFMDALEILNSNKEEVLKLIEDPNSHFYKHIQDLQKTQVGKVAKLGSENHPAKVRLFLEDSVSSRKGDKLDNSELLHKQSRHSFFWKKDKLKGAKPSTQSQNWETTNRAVVLKPSPLRTQENQIMTTVSFSPVPHHKIRHGEEEGDRVVSQFSLREIKRRLKRILGGSRKERRVISMDGVLHRIPIGYKVSGDKDKLLHNESVVTSLESKPSHDTEKSSEVLPISKDSQVNPEECELNIKSGISDIKPTLIYEEAKKHLAEMLDTGDQTASLPTAHISKSLGRLLSMPEYDVLSPRVKPQSKKELVLPSEETRSLPLRQVDPVDATSSLTPLKQSLEVSNCSTINQTHEVLMLDMKTELTDNHMQEELCIESDSNHEGSVQNVDAVDIINMLLPNNSDASLEPNSNESNVVCERCYEDLGSLELESHTLTQPEFSPRSFLRDNLEAPESTIGKPGRSSPVSIIEKFILEDFTGPKLRAVHSMVPTLDARANLRNYFEDSQVRFKYVEAVLKVSGLSTIDFSERWHLSDKLLEPSLFDKVGISCCPQADDPKLLFDCISEALEEMQEKFFKCTPWLALITCNVQKAPVGRSLTREVSRRIESHIPMRLPNTVDLIVTKDLEDRSWMDLQFETENIVIEMWDTVLDDLVEEAIFDLWLEL